jgi:hypothetical protein
MTLNQIIERIKGIAEAHGQINSFGANSVLTEFLTSDIKYATCFLQFMSGSIATSNHALTITFRMFLLDVVNRSEETLGNEQDIQSDMISVAEDLVAKMNRSEYQDWALSPVNSINLLSDYEKDFLAGCYVDFSIRTPFTQNICQIPAK